MTKFYEELYKEMKYLYLIDYEPDNYDFETNFTAVLASLSNIGPGLSKVGPSQNYAFLSPLSKYVLMFDMIAGRLELYPILLLFYYKMWRERIIPKRADSSNNLSASI